MRSKLDPALRVESKHFDSIALCWRSGQQVAFEVEGEAYRPLRRREGRVDLTVETDFGELRLRRMTRREQTCWNKGR